MLPSSTTGCRSGPAHAVSAAVLLVPALLLPLSCGYAPQRLEAGHRDASLEQLLYSVVNHHRSSIGMNELEWDDTLAWVCMNHCRDMAEGVRDTGHGGIDYRMLVVDAMLGFAYYGENVSEVAGVDSPVSLAYMGWYNSPAHRRNMESSTTRTGVGAWVTEDGVCYFVQIYVRDPGCTPVASLSPPR